MKWVWYLAGALLILLVGAFFLPRQNPDIGDIRFGFIHAVENGAGYSIVFDEARWLTGTEGEDAAIASGHCTEETRSECLPNGFFILNESEQMEQIPVASQPIVAMATLKMETEGVKETDISMDEFAQLIRDEDAQWHELPYQVLVKDGIVTIIEEVYVP